MKAIEIHQDYDPTNCTSTGYDYHIRQRRNGGYFLTATSHSRWQGSRSNDRWELDLDASSVEEAIEEARDILCLSDDCAHLAPFIPPWDDQWHDDTIGTTVDGWCLARKGYIVR